MEMIVRQVMIGKKRQIARLALIPNMTLAMVACNDQMVSTLKVIDQILGKDIKILFYGPVRGPPQRPLWVSGVRW